MAFTGLRVSCHYAGQGAVANSLRATMPLPNGIEWSEEIDTEGVVSTHAAVGEDAKKGRPMFRISVEADALVAIGPEPDTDVEKLMIVWASEPYTDIFVNPGDKIAWKAL